MKWREAAVSVIQQALADAEKQGLDKAGTLKLVDSCYPFGQRAMHPYKVWLKARRDLVTKPAKPATPNSVRNFWTQETR